MELQSELMSSEPKDAKDKIQNPCLQNFQMQKINSKSMSSEYKNAVARQCHQNLKMQKISSVDMTAIISRQNQEIN